MKRYVWVNTDLCGYLKLFEHAPNKDCYLLICDNIDQIDNCNKTAETEKNVAIVQTDDIRTEVCLKHDYMALHYLILKYSSCNNDCFLQCFCFL